MDSKMENQVFCSKQKFKEFLAFSFQSSLVVADAATKSLSNTGVSNRWTGIWDGTVEWIMEWNVRKPKNKKMGEDWERG